MSTEVERKIRSEHTAMVKEMSQARAVTNDRVLSAYRQMVFDGNESVPALAKKFDLTERQVQCIINRRGKSNNPKLAVMIEGKMVRHFEGLDGIVHMAVDEMRSQYLDLLAKEDTEKFCDIELVEISEAGKLQRTQRKKVPIGKAKLELLNEMANAHMKFFGAVNKLLGPANVNVFQDNRQFTGSFAEIQDQLRSLRSMEKLRGVDSVIEGEADG